MKSKRRKYTVDEFLAWMEEINPEALYPTDMKEAIVGYLERFGMDPIIVLDREKCLKILMDQGMTYDDALEYFYFNTIGAWVGDGTPGFLVFANDPKKEW